MKVMIVNAFGRSNRGDSVLLDECISEIKAGLPDAEIGCAVFEGIDDATRIHPDVIWSERIGNASGKSPFNRITAFFRVFVAIAATLPFFSWLSTLLPKSQRLTWRLIRSADIVVSAPGGYIHDTNFAYYIALLHISLARKKRSRNILAPQSIGPIDSKLARYIARHVLGSADAICARESYTLSFLKDELGLDSRKIFPSGDSAFWNSNVLSIDDPKVDEILYSLGFNPSKKKGILGITVVDWSFPKSNDVEAMRSNYVKSLVDVIDCISDKYNFQPIIFNQVSEDLGMAKLIAEASSSGVIVDAKDHEPDVLRALISKSTIFLGTRFHSCIFAMMASRPTFAISYLPKTEYILKDLKLTHRQIPIDIVESSRIITALEADLVNVSKSSDEIKFAVNEYRRTHARLSDILREAL